MWIFSLKNISQNSGGEHRGGVGVVQIVPSGRPEMSTNEGLRTTGIQTPKGGGESG